MESLWDATTRRLHFIIIENTLWNTKQHGKFVYHRKAGVLYSHEIVGFVSLRHVKHHRYTEYSPTSRITRVLLPEGLVQRWHNRHTHITLTRYCCRFFKMLHNHTVCICIRNYDMFRVTAFLSGPLSRRTQRHTFEVRQTTF